MKSDPRQEKFPSAEQMVVPLKKKILANSYVYIMSTNGNESFDQPVYAINWFNTRMLWLYNFYNLVASVSVRRVGGSAFFKGRVEKVLIGDNSDRRDVLLVVNYPSPKQFLAMLGSRYFLLVSILRMLAVKQFTFGFTSRTDSDKPSSQASKPSAYAVHHYRSDQDIAKQLEIITDNADVDIFYAGRISALVSSGNNHKAGEQIDCLMDGIILLKSKTTAQISALIQQEDYQLVINQTRKSFIAILSRMI